MYLLTILSQHVDSNYKLSVTISTFKATIYLKGVINKKGTCSTSIPGNNSIQLY